MTKYKDNLDKNTTNKRNTTKATNTSKTTNTTKTTKTACLKKLIEVERPALVLVEHSEKALSQKSVL